jgi:hypothetical protein
MKMACIGSIIGVIPRRIKIMIIRKMALSGLVAACLFLTSCGGSGEPTLVDLNKVLDAVVETLDQFSTDRGGQADASAVDTASEAEMDEFLAACTDNMNRIQVTDKPVALAFLDDGSFEGFVDENLDAFKDPNEKQIFTVVIDAERNRLIATDTQNGYNRDSGFSMGGMMAGMLIGSMLSRQSAAGVNTNKFKNTRMSPSNYHTGAARQAKAAASARARTSSGSFSSGK